MKTQIAKKVLSTLGIAFVGGMTSIGAYKALNFDEKDVIFQQASDEKQGVQFRTAGTNFTAPADFIAAAEKSTPAVVHIRSMSKAKSGRTQQMPDIFRDFFGDQFQFDDRGREPVLGSGSGVILSPDGYIVTNNHVIDEADEIEVTLYDKRSYKAKLIGTDPSTDLAVIKIEDNNLPVMVLGNSDAVRVGEWVLAVGNPFNLSSTVTAGIVSAKSRNISILKDNAAIESFIQTDAAVNPGNSGGALVNTRGELIGINTAIATQTGTYAGYAFAVPVDMMKKVTEDLIKYGVVQRAMLGITIRDVTAVLAREKELPSVAGVLVDSVINNGSAAAAGIRSEDVILSVDGIPTNTVPQLQETIARHRPGDVVNVRLLRNGKEQNIKVELKNRSGKAEIVKREEKGMLDVLGVDLEEVPAKELKRLDIQGGVKVKNIRAGKIRSNTDMRPGFIITKVDRKPVKTIQDVTNALNQSSGGVMLEGVYSDYPGVYYYAFGL